MNSNTRIFWPEPGIMVVREAFDRSDEVITWSEMGEKWKPSTERTANGELIRTSRTSSSANLSGYKKIDSVAAELDDYVHRVISTELQRYRNRHRFLDVRSDTGYDVLRYHIGEGYGLHVDDGQADNRRVSCLIYLNEDFIGGELNFPEQNVMIKPEKGMLVMFPSSFMYPHQSIDIKYGNKYAIVTWIK